MGVGLGLGLAHVYRSTAEAGPLTHDTTGALVGGGGAVEGASEVAFSVTVTWVALETPAAA